MSTRVWVVECQFVGGGWEPCTLQGEVQASDNYYDAHQLKREAIEYLDAKSTWWSKDKFRVREYAPKAK